MATTLNVHEAKAIRHPIRVRVGEEIIQDKIGQPYARWEHIVAHVPTRQARALP